MGTSSVGWAVTDNKYQLLRKKGKDLWGIREFEPAESAAERRSHRISRRRRQRECVRIGHIKEYFSDAIQKVDPYFYQRMENSKYFQEDKDIEVNGKNGIFDDEDYKDADYYEDYPTIFHLRKELIENKNAPYDVRFVYLAVLNIFKRRGHFLNSSLNIENEEFSSDIKKSYYHLIQLLNTTFEEADETEKIVFPDPVSDETLIKIQEYLASRNYSRKRKAEMIIDALGLDMKKVKERKIIEGITGLQLDCKKIFPLSHIEEDISVKFSDFNYSEKETGILEVLGETYGELLLAIKEIYNIGALFEILKGEKTYLSVARVDDYNQHKKDLTKLKSMVRKYDEMYGTEEYNFFFRDSKDGSYSAYVNSTNSDDNKNKNRKRRGMKNRTKDDFYKSVKKILEKMPESDEDAKYIKTAIETETFMPKQLTASNGVISNQVHAMELKKILENASEYLDFLNDKDGSGLSVKERILRLFIYTIPYYTGPTSKRSSNGWIVRKTGYEEGEILPWEYDFKVDERKTRTEFITKMVRKCTYFSDQMVLPKQSLKYEKYCVLNEINNIRIDNIRIDNALKQSLYNEVFKTGKKPSRKKIEQYLFNHGVPENAQITGIDKEINHSLSSYGKFKPVFGEDMERDSIKDMIEDIIFQCTIFGDDKKHIKKYLMETYPENEYPMMTENTVKRILGLRFKDWGRFSADILDLQGYNHSTGEKYSLLTALWETNYNFMELLNSEQFTYRTELENTEKKMISSLSQVTPELLDDYYFSAPVKRMIIQTMGVIKEIKNAMGCEPTRIFIEMTRHDDTKGEKGRKDSRKKKLLDLYKNVKDELNDKKYWSDLIEHKEQSGELKRKKMYLYLLQMGRDMYTGEEIDLDDLFTTKYDIDHIYPRHFVKDDNLENNLVLVNKSDNENSVFDALNAHDPSTIKFYEI